MPAPGPSPTASPPAARDLVVARSAQWAAWWMALGNALALVVQGLALDRSLPTTADEPWLRPFLIGLDITLTAVGVALAWRIRRGPARWPVVVVLAWLVVEFLGKVTGPRPLGAAIDVVFMLVAGRALGAAQTLHAGCKARRIDPEVF